MADAHANFASSTVATIPSPATSGTSLVVATGEGAKFPAVPFNATIWPASAQPSTTNAEIVRVTARSTDTLTITRAQESTSARTVIVGDQIVAGITAKTLTDVETDLATKASVLTRTAVKTSNYTAVLGDLVPCNTSGGAFTVTLPAASGGLGRIVIKLVTAGNTLNLALTGSDHFNTSAGPTTGTLTLANQGIILESDGSSIWTVTADDIPLSVLDARYQLTALTGKAKSGEYWISPFTSVVNASTRTLANGFMGFVPIWLPAGTYNQVAIKTNSAGSAGSVARLGLYSPDANGRPGALVADWGTVAIDTAAGVKTITVSLTIATDGLYYLAGVTQVAASGNIYTQDDPRIFGRALASTFGPDATFTWLQASVTGALPNPAVPTVNNNPQWLMAIGLKAA